MLNKPIVDNRDTLAKLSLTMDLIGLGHLYIVSYILILTEVSDMRGEILK